MSNVREPTSSTAGMMASVFAAPPARPAVVTLEAQRYADDQLKRSYAVNPKNDERDPRICRLAASGLNAPQIASRMGVSPSTVLRVLKAAQR